MTASLRPDQASERADALVVFGATGDLARKKLHPAIYRLVLRDRLDVPVVGVARSEWSHEQFRVFARDAVTKRFGSAPEADLEAYAEPPHVRQW